MAEPAAALDWRAQHRFFLEVETPGWNRFMRRWRHLRILLTRLIDSDFLFAERLRLRRTWQVWLLRPIRLLLRTVRASPASP
jgi:ribosome maturation factor RimP